MSLLNFSGSFTKSENENECQYIWRICNAKDKGLIDMTWQEVADILNLNLKKDYESLSESAYRKKYQQAKLFYDEVFSKIENKNGISEIEKETVETSINKDGSYSSKRFLIMNEEQSKNPDYILKAHGYSPNDWKIVSAKNNIREIYKSSIGKDVLYSSYITVKPLDSSEISLGRYEQFFDNLDRKYSLPKIKHIENSTEGDKLLLIDIADLHLNLQSSLFTTGEDYNCDIAEDLFFKVINDILTKTKNYQFSKIIFTVGGDMLNADNLMGTTTRGTPQNNDIHFYDAYERLCAMTIKAIDLLKDISPVDVVYVSGNHDEVSGFKLAKYIDAWFRNEDSVKVDYSPLPRKYYKFGKTLLCFAHDGDIKRLPTLISDEARQYWSDVDTTEVFLQHLHSEQVLVENNNIRIQRLPTISAKSKWSSDKGFNSKRQCKSFIFDIDDGLQNVLYTPIKRRCEYEI